MVEMKKFYVGIKGVLREERGVLILKRANALQEHWDIPGGRIDGSENFEDTLKRELAEELPGTELVAVKDLLGAYRLPKDISEDTGLILLYFLAEARIPTEVKCSEEHSDFKWVKSIEDIPKSGLNPEATEAIKVALNREV